MTMILILSTEINVAIYPFAISATIAPILAFLHLRNINNVTAKMFMMKIYTCLKIN